MIFHCFCSICFAVEALKSLSKGDIGEIKAMKSPPKGVKLVMEAVCVMFDLKPGVFQIGLFNFYWLVVLYFGSLCSRGVFFQRHSTDRITSDDGKSKINDYWKPAQKLLADMRFLQNCFEYDKDNIRPDIIAAIAPFISSPDFEPKVIEKVSRAANGLCKWVRALYIYSQVAAVVQPKRDKLKEAQAELEVTEQLLREKQAALKVISDRVAALEASFALTLKEQEDLKQQVVLCETKLMRAEKLISGLGGESVRWSAQLSLLKTQSEHITSNSLISAAIVSYGPSLFPCSLITRPIIVLYSYLGAFTGSFRERCIALWTASVSSLGLSIAQDFSFAAAVGDPVLIRSWNLSGLPRDTISVDNAVIMSLSGKSLLQTASMWI
jgi:dynein heavy chain